MDDVESLVRSRSMSPFRSCLARLDLPDQKHERNGRERDPAQDSEAVHKSQEVYLSQEVLIDECVCCTGSVCRTNPLIFRNPGDLVVTPTQGPSMYGKATFAIDVSRSSMKVASVTVSAIAHGLMTIALLPWVRAVSLDLAAPLRGALPLMWPWSAPLGTDKR